jgi:hypothetical protein
MTPLERKHDTKIPYIIDTEDGPKDAILDLATLSDDDLAQYIFEIPQAVEEIVYRELSKEVATQNTNNNN